MGGKSLSEIETFAARLDRLETSFAHQDRIIEDLNLTITAQWQAIEALKRQIRRLSEQLAEAQSGAGSEPSREPPPPHY